MTGINPATRVDVAWPMSQNLERPSGSASKTFTDILKTSLGEVNRLQLETDNAIQSLITGEENNVHEVMVAMEKASLSLELLVQVRNKVIAAYEEIKRMQV
jgi:flagellar hook-basal body complex protein FliE